MAGASVPFLPYNMKWRCAWRAGSATSSASPQHVEADRDAAQARVSELEGQVEAMIQQMGSGPFSSSRSTLSSELEAERDAAQARVAELEAQVLHHCVACQAWPPCQAVALQKPVTCLLHMTAGSSAYPELVVQHAISGPCAVSMLMSGSHCDGCHRPHMSRVRCLSEAGRS